VTTHDDFAANEQLAHAELGAVMRQLRAGKLDLTRAIRTPSQDRGKDVVLISFRYAMYIDGAINDLCGKGRKFANRSEFLRHYAVVGLAIEKLLADEPLRDARVIQAAQQDADDQMRAIDETVDACAKALDGADGDHQRQLVLARLSELRELCEFHGYIDRMADIDNAIHGKRRR